MKNDIWIGDEAMFMGGCTIENGCVIGARTVVPPNFKTEPYGIYVGSPARLVRFRFSEKIVEQLLKLQWWDKGIEWLEKNNNAFIQNLNEMDESEAIELLKGLQ